MNNNGMPNGFGNIMGNFNNNTNNSNTVDPITDQANQALMGGQGTEQTADVMQGFSNVSNGNSAMQGVGNVSNEPGIMQNPAPEVEPPVQMPGQTHSGINSYTMQYENNTESSAQTPQVESSAAPAMNSVSNIEGTVEDHTVAMNNGVPNPFLDKFVNEQTVNNINQPVNNMGMAQPNVGLSSSVIEPIPQQELDTTPTEEPANSNIPNIPSVEINTTSNQPINSAEIEVMPYTNNYDMTNVSIEPNPAPATVNPVDPSPTPMPSYQDNNIGINQPIDNTSDLNTSTIGVTPTNIDVMQQDQMINNVEDPSVMPNKKKFPLSLRETILVTIALIGIIIVIVMYWPN